MKPPHGLAYAILIVVAILAVTLYAKRQSSSISVKAQIQEPVADDAPSATKGDGNSRAEGTKNTEEDK